VHSTPSWSFCPTGHARRCRRALLPAPRAEPKKSCTASWNTSGGHVQCDCSRPLRLGEGSGFLYAYGYGCAPDRLKIGMTTTDTVQHIAAQISTGTLDKPLLKLEIKTARPSKLEDAIHAVLDYRGRRVTGGGKEWFLTSRDELIDIYKFITGTAAAEADTDSRQ
jgi:hypothetical protein